MRSREVSAGVSSPSAVDQASQPLSPSGDPVNASAVSPSDVFVHDVSAPDPDTSSDSEDSSSGTSSSSDSSDSGSDSDTDSSSDDDVQVFPKPAPLAPDEPVSSSPDEPAPSPSTPSGVSGPASALRI